MTDSAELTLTLRVLASASDARRGIVRLHPEVLTALGMRQWDALELVGARTTAAVAAASPVDTSQALCIVDEVIAANCGLTDDSRVIVRPAEVIGFNQGRLKAAYGVLNDHLDGRDWIVGDDITNADLSCCGYLYYPEPFGFDRSDWPHIDAWLTRLSETPGWKAPYDLMPGSPADRA